LGDKIENNEMGGACGMYGERRGEAYTGFWWGDLGERDQLGDPGIDGRIILTWSALYSNCGIIFQIISRRMLETWAVIYSAIQFWGFVHHVMYKSVENL
jgi:hypothetical protein